MKVTGKKEERPLFYRREVLTRARLGQREKVRTASFYRVRNCEFLNLKELRRKFSTRLWRAGWRVRLSKPDVTKETRVQWRTTCPPYERVVAENGAFRSTASLPVTCPPVSPDRTDTPIGGCPVCPLGGTARQSGRLSALSALSGSVIVVHRPGVAAELAHLPSLDQLELRPVECLLDRVRLVALRQPVQNAHGAPVGQGDHRARGVVRA